MKWQFRSVFLADGDCTKFEEFLREGKFALLTEAHRNYRANKWPEIIASACTPVRFVSSIFKQDPSPLEREITINGKVFSLSIDNAGDIIRSAYPFGWDEMAEVKTIDQEKLDSLLELQEIPWNDIERILRNEQPVDTASPGQRSSAMLPLIALAESVPLVIDQPEDNLDNRLVGKVLVEILAKLKEKRQIIVMTHNPNIVVLGDAEQVIVVDAVSDTKGKTLEPQASIDDPFIVKSVIDLMEGGKDAFEIRKKRYQM